MNIPYHNTESLETIFWAKKLKFFGMDPVPGSIIFLTRDPGWKISDPQHLLKVNFEETWMSVEVEQERRGWHMDEWAALDREASEWDAMERGGVDMQARVQTFFFKVLITVFDGFWPLVTRGTSD